MTNPLTSSLHARRSIVGAASPEGRRLSMTAEILKSINEAESDWQRDNLKAALGRIAKEIPQIRRDGGQYIHANHGAGR